MHVFKSWVVSKLTWCRADVKIESFSNFGVAGRVFSSQRKEKENEKEKKKKKKEREKKEKKERSKEIKEYII